MKLALTEIVTRSASETEALAERLARSLKSGDVVALGGDLGAGKTTFVRGLARGLGAPARVVSPTYVLAARYELPEGSPAARIDHFDAYLLEKERAFLAEGGAEILGAEGISVVEWADRIEDLLPEERIEIALSVGTTESERIVTFRGRGARGSELVDALSEAAQVRP